MSEDFISPPLGWSLASIIGGLVTATLIIVGVESLCMHLKQKNLYSPQPEPELYTQQVR
ncbi:MAG: hypothetical protein F6K11_26010 [Leptolyngbya sp. SIO3F4]|nr:hypothetical protein [Leptolyngbya sp. SIO3F4]